MDDDFNTPGAIKAIFEIAASINRRAPLGISRSSKERAERAIMDIAGVLGILTGEGRDLKLTEAQKALIEERNMARKSGDYKTSDRIRDQLASQGIAIDDTKDGQKARKI
jgi:cysteinyl-tRNA synthetase